MGNVLNLKVLVLSAVVCAFGASSARAAVLYQENFDNWAMDTSVIGTNGWSGTTDNCAKVINFNGSNALGLRGSNWLNMPDINWNPGNSGEVLTLQWDMSISPDISGGDMGLYDATNNGQSFVTDESLFYGSKMLGGARETGFHYKMVADSGTGWLRYYMNGIEVNNSWGVAGSQWDLKNLVIGTFNMSDDGYVTIDNISATTSAAPVPEPATMAVLAGGAVSLLRRRRKA